MLLQKSKQNTANTTSVPPPIGGWNARDSLANMNPLDAVQLINFFATPTDVTMRAGYTVSSVITTSTNAKTITIGNVTGATGLVVNTGTGGTLFNTLAGSYVKVAKTVAPTVDMVQITNTGFPVSATFWRRALKLLSPDAILKAGTIGLRKSTESKSKGVDKKITSSRSASFLSSKNCVFENAYRPNWFRRSVWSEDTRRFGIIV
jgi:hypothetical protein